MDTSSTEADILRRDMFSALAYDDGMGLFYLHPGALGFGLQIAPMASNDPAIGTKLNTLLNLPFPNDTHIQVSMYASPDIEAAIESYANMRRGVRDPVLKRITAERIAFLRQGTTAAVDSVSGTRIRDVKIMLTVRFPIAAAQPSDKEFQAASELRAAVLQTAHSCGLRAVPLDAQGYVRFMASALNHKPTASWREVAREHYDPTRLLCDQILDGDTAIHADAKGLWLGEEARVKLLHVKQYPAFVDFGDAMRYLGDFITGDRGIREPVVAALNLFYINHETRSARLQTDLALVEAQMEKRVARFVNAFRNRRESLHTAIQAVEDGDRLVAGYFGLAVMAPSEEASIAAVSNARAYFRELGFRLMEDRFICRELFFGLLPFAADPALRSALSRYTTMPTRSATNLMPVLGSWAGTGSAMLTLFARDGQLMPLSPYDSASNYNICVAAASGSGKSFLVNELITNFLATGGRAWAIDIGGSYRNLCQVLGGTYLRFDAGTRINLNPFARVEDYEEEVDILVGALTAMAAPNQGLSDRQSAELRRAVRQVWDERGKSATIDDLADRLMAHEDPRVVDVGGQLFPFTEKGEYGRFFSNANPPFDSDSRFIVCELEELRGREHLLRVVLMELMALIQQQMYLSDRAMPKLLVIDEAWDLLGRSDARSFIVGSYRRARKHNGCIVTITQSILDYWRNEGAQAIVENSANWYLLRQKADAIAEVEKDRRLPFGPAGYTLLQTLTTVPGQFSEIFAITDRGMGIGRLVVSPFNRLLYSTTPGEVEAIKHLEAHGMTTEQAIEALLAQHDRKRA